MRRGSRRDEKRAMNTGIFLYNTLTRRKEELIPREAGKVSLYVCGVTPYDALHIGHARAFMVYDVLRRVLEARGLEVRHVQNVTDVDDKIINRAAELGLTAKELAERYTAEAAVDTQALNILPAHHYPRVTDHIGPIVEMVQVLENKQFAYARGGDVYFDVSKDDDYGKLSRQKPEDLEAGARIEPGEHKDDPLDFALWKGAKPGEPSWAAPWGEGRPGWHIECSAMALHLLGPGFDIHGGAVELVFPHHENEVAQSESYLDGEAFARLWWHCGVVQVDSKKMSKSLGNFLTMRDGLKIAPPNVWRLFFLMTHPRSPLDYSEERLMQAKNAWSRLHALAEVDSSRDGQAPDESNEAVREFRTGFDAALADDLNTPEALAAVFDAVSEWHRHRQDALARAARAALETLGFSFETQIAGDQLTPRLIELLVQVRQEARERRDFKSSDGIRDALKELGILLEDTPEGTRWKIEQR
ncbi:MAG: cysteine--tRNA ligase [Armatimonadota bacterium]|nr:cysteine--tRNA ligase [Armatimonadota bacterium]